MSVIDFHKEGSLSRFGQPADVTHYSSIASLGLFGTPQSASPDIEKISNTTLKLKARGLYLFSFNARVAHDSYGTYNGGTTQLRLVRLLNDVTLSDIATYSNTYSASPNLDVNYLYDNPIENTLISFRINSDGPTLRLLEYFGPVTVQKF